MGIVSVEGRSRTVEGVAVRGADGSQIIVDLYRRSLGGRSLDGRNSGRRSLHKRIDWAALHNAIVVVVELLLRSTLLGSDVVRPAGPARSIGPLNAGLGDRNDVPGSWRAAVDHVPELLNDAVPISADNELVAIVDVVDDVGLDGGVD